MINLHTFHGGCHPPENKDATKDTPSRPGKQPPFVAVSFAQHMGAPSVPLVKSGERVLRGQKIAGDAPKGLSTCAHASISGTVRNVVQLRHPLGYLVDAIKIENDGQDEWHPDCCLDRDISKLDTDEIKKIIHEAGIVGMGGATFPTHVKLSPPPGMKIDTVILNGSECEPYLTADDRLMSEKPEEILLGATLLAKSVNAERIFVGMENNKPRAFQIMTEAVKKLGLNIEVVALPVKYPQGAEKQLIYALTGRQVPSGGLPAATGSLVQNVSTAFAVYDACRYGHPLTERIMTVTGPGVSRPANLWIRIGTMASFILDECGFDPVATKKLIAGGPMMGMPMRDLDWASSKGGNGILCLTDPGAFEHDPCIRCGRCIEACPMSLLPYQLSNYGEAGLLAESKEANALDCIECGCCTYVCPSKRPIVQWVRMEKAELGRLRSLEMAAKNSKK